MSASELVGEPSVRSGWVDRRLSAFPAHLLRSGPAASGQPTPCRIAVARKPDVRLCAHISHRARHCLNPEADVAADDNRGREDRLRMIETAYRVPSSGS